MTRGLFRGLAFPCVLVIVAGCAPATKIVSNIDKGYQSEPKRIFVVSHVGTEFGKEFGDSFRTRLIAAAKECGVTVEVSAVNPLELDKNAQANQMKNFKPDSLMLIRRAGGTRSQYGAVFHVIYDVGLVDIKSDKRVWRANVNFYRGGTAIPIEERGVALAMDLASKMKEDRILKSCPEAKAAS